MLQINPETQINVIVSQYENSKTYKQEKKNSMNLRTKINHHAQFGNGVMMCVLKSCVYVKKCFLFIILQCNLYLEKEKGLHLFEYSKTGGIYVCIIFSVFLRCSLLTSFFFFEIEKKRIGGKKIHILHAREKDTHLQHNATDVLYAKRDGICCS